MKKINSMKTLKEEKLRLKIELANTENKLKEDMNWLVEELKPISKISKGVSKLFNFKENGFVSDTLGSGAGFVFKKILLGNSSWIVKLLVPLIVKNISSNLIADKKLDFLSIVKGIIHKYKSERHKENGHYDRSTAQSNY